MGRIKQAGRRYHTKSHSSPFQPFAHRVQKQPKNDEVSTRRTLSGGIYLLLRLALIVREDLHGRLVMVKKKSTFNKMLHGLMISSCIGQNSGSKKFVLAKTKAHCWGRLFLISLMVGIFYV